MTTPEEPAEDPTTQDKAQQKPLLKVIDHNATPEEIAAIVAVFSALGSGQAPTKKPRSLWATPKLRTPIHPGPNAWRASAFPS
ncbi:acyl-CoA carboxylase subunit epsilon [Nocardioides sp. NPDC057577]|uniref:acyl-CoA carboxylase subunit epsilon n=1 Tax=Nocardioides sp. NPDC057577 TaxID=3346171 RepID=UPI00366A8209